MLPTAFLSLSGTDAEFVRRVHALLPDALAYFYERSFANGEHLITAMEDRVGHASVFVLFASRASVSSVWVNFEIDRARIAKIKNHTFRVLVFPIDAELSLRDLPIWMQEFWIGNAGRRARDVARYLRHVLSEVAADSTTLNEPVGRGGLTDDIVESLNGRLLRHDTYPNIFIFGGHTGIGRRTVKAKLLKQAFTGLPEINYGPELELPQFGDSVDLYRKLRNELEENLSQVGYEADEAAFIELGNAEKAQELARGISVFGEMGQAVTIVSGNGIFEDKGILKSWASDLFSALQETPKSYLFILSNRLAHENELRRHPNVLQVEIPSLKDSNTETIIISTAKALKKTPELPNGHVIRAIGGHPGIARTTAHLIAKTGAQALNDNMKDLYIAQDQVLSKSLSFDRLDVVERDVLSILSWVPRISAFIVRDVVCELHQMSPEKFSDVVGSLALSCLMVVSGPNYAISGPIRSMFRRLHGFGSKELQEHLARTLESEWRQSTAIDEFPTEIFDALVFMLALEGASFPAELQRLLLPATLHGVVKDTYDGGHDDDDAMRRVVALGLPAQGMRMQRIDETTREEILSFVVRAQTRLQDHQGAKALLKFFDERGYRSAFYLRAFYIRQTGGDLTKAVELLKQAREVRKYSRRVIGDLALCYQRLGRWKDLNELIAEEAQLQDDPVLMDLQIGQLIAAGKIVQAENAIVKLKAQPRDSGRSESRTAQILMRRDQNYGEAKRLLTSLLQRASGGRIAVRRLRAIAAVEDGDLETAARDVEFLRSRANGPDTALRIEARMLNKQERYTEAEAKLEAITSVVAADHLLRARILDNRGNDVREGLADRNTFHKKASELRAKYGDHSEFDLGDA